jgi:hypothetical protein
MLYCKSVANANPIARVELNARQQRKIPSGVMFQYAASLQLFKKVLAQKRNDTQKIYSLHEPHVQCISKGKEDARCCCHELQAYDEQMEEKPFPLFLAPMGLSVFL